MLSDILLTLMSHMTELKTKLTKASVLDFINAIGDEQKKKDSKIILKMLGRVTGQKPEMWGSSMVGFGRYSYTGSNGKTNQWMATGFSPRKQNLTIYILPGYSHDSVKSLLAKLGKYKNGKSCLYINRLEDIDMKVLEQLVKKGYKAIAGKHIDYRKLRSLF